MEIPIAGQSLSVESTEYALVLGNDNGFEIQAEAPVEFETPSGDKRRVAFDEEDHFDLDLNTFFSGKIASAFTGSAGELTILLESGNRATVTTDEDYESWTIVGPKGYRVVCMPGGELATWSPE
ncbi:DUF6188 family protein [Nocardia jiangxiensis]|uniref:DUF6188 family protein n=1 Tax=Nocardia jiangxiensis TaxID=282685 RepID=A0ABW6RYP3_9NOCA|nr:DUF6188 family protein [Nocardia jiangxiensis]